MWLGDLSLYTPPSVWLIPLSNIFIEWLYWNGLGKSCFRCWRQTVLRYCLKEVYFNLWAEYAIYRNKTWALDWNLTKLVAELEVLLSLVGICSLSWCGKHWGFVWINFRIQFSFRDHQRSTCRQITEKVATDMWLSSCQGVREYISIAFSHRRCPGWWSLDMASTLRCSFPGTQTTLRWKLRPNTH